MKWKIHYIDGSTFSSEEGKPQDAPRQGVAVIVQFIGSERKVEWRSDTYCWEENQWIPHDRFGCETYIDKTPIPIRLVGYCQPDDKFWMIYEDSK